MFDEAPSSPAFPQIENQVLEFWKDRAIYQKSLDQRADAPRFVFYEGPPTANGLPHPGHCLTRAIKDLFPRYRTMRGYLCERKGGWDTHGLPVEVEVCKSIGIHSKEEIEEFGVEPFIHKCQESVWRYMKEWEQLTERLGFWIHLEDAYVTYHQQYVESVWWSLKNLFDRDLLYQGHKIVWWWAQGGTALSAGEVGEGYREVGDPSVYVRFPLVDEPDVSLLVWTTTPWTLPSNQFAAVNPDLTYATVADKETGEKFALAEDLVETVAGKAKREFEVVETYSASRLIGQRYQPPFDYYYKATGDSTGTLKDGGKQHVAWRVLGADFVTTKSGTGVVHQAPAFGEDDYNVLTAEQERFVEDEGPQLICAVGPDGKFTAEAPDYEGRWVKEADKDISRELRSRGVLFHLEQYLHDYPFCWRAPEDPLIQYPRKSWFVRTTKFRDRMLENNQRINWLPEHIQGGRFGNFLESNVDWALSRERYWGTPLPVWVCEETGKQEAIGSYTELQQKPGASGFDVWEKAKAANPALSDDLRVHKPYIDAITYDSPFADGARMNRVPEVIDCWYDSGAMPFAQWGYPHTGQDDFKEQFPADFISEAIDQTRGWFYSQLAISTMLFGPEAEGVTTSNDAANATKEAFPHPFRNCIVLGLMLSEWWENKKNPREISIDEAEAREKFGKDTGAKIGKMSKQLKNYRSPQEIFDIYGADALRWYFFANQAPWNGIIYSEKAIKESIPEFMLRLWHVYRFFVDYARIDGFDPAAGVKGDVHQLTTAGLEQSSTYTPVAQRGELDRWILSELNRTLATVIDRMDNYDNYLAASSINEFVDTLSNWWLRRSRPRFWASDKNSQDKLDAFWTLYECLVTLTKQIAPFTPFFAETLWRNLSKPFEESATADDPPESVHLCDFPAVNESVLDESLSEEMQVVREVVSLCHNARKEARLKVRQPLAGIEVVVAREDHSRWLTSHEELIRDEVNVKQVSCTTDADEYIAYQVQPNFKRLGPRVGKLVPAVKKTLASADGASLLKELQETGKIALQVTDSDTIELDGEDIQIRLQAKPGYAAAQGKQTVVVLSTELTPELINEGKARDFNRLVQDRRKELNLEMSDRITIGVESSDAPLIEALRANETYLKNEALAVEIRYEASAGEPVEREIGDAKLTLYVAAVV